MTNNFAIVWLAPPTVVNPFEATLNSGGAGIALSIRRILGELVAVALAAEKVGGKPAIMEVSD